MDIYETIKREDLEELKRKVSITNPRNKKLLRHFANEIRQIENILNDLLYR